MLVIVGSWSQLKMKTGPQKLMLTFPIVTDSFFIPPSIHDMQLKTKQTNEKIPPHKTDLKVASSHIIVVFPRRL